VLCTVLFLFFWLYDGHLCKDLDEVHLFINHIGGIISIFFVYF